MHRRQFSSLHRSRSRSSRVGGPVLTAALLSTMILSQTGCATEEMPRRARVLASPDASAQVVGAVHATPGQSLERPEWLAASVPIPADAQLTAVDSQRCSVVWVRSGADLQASAAELVAEAREAGLEVALTSSAERPDAPSQDPDLFTEDFGDALTETPTPTLRTLALRMRGGGTAEVALEAQLTAMPGGVLVGEYHSTADDCPR